MADAPPEKSLDDFFAKRDKKKKKEKGKGKESTAGPTSAAMKKTKKEKEKSAKNENQDAQIEKVTEQPPLLPGNFSPLSGVFFPFPRTDVVSKLVTLSQSPPSSYIYPLSVLAYVPSSYEGNRGHML